MTGDNKSALPPGTIAKLRLALACLLYAGAMLHATWLGFTLPLFNWDMLGYTGSVIAWGEKDPATIHTKTMEVVRENVPSPVYKSFMSTPFFSETEPFIEVLPYYQVKPLYTASMWLLHQAGVAIPSATWVISATSFCLLSMLLFCWRPHFMAKEVWLLMVVGLTYLYPWPMASLARYSTPDCYATLLVMAALYLWLWRRSFLLFCTFSWLALLARPDTIILCGALALYFTVIPAPPDRMPLKGAACLLAVLCATYLIDIKLSRNYGLERWFIFTFIDRKPLFANAVQHVTLNAYWHTLTLATALFLSAKRQLMMLAFSVIALLFHYLRPAAGNRQWLHLMVIIWGCLALRFVLFPAWSEDRYYFVYYLPILFSGGELIASYTCALWKLLQRHRRSIAEVH